MGGLYEREYIECLWAQTMRRKKNTHTQKEGKEGEDRNTSVCFVGEWRGGGSPGREEGQANKRCSEWEKYNWWIVLEGMLPLWIDPALQPPHSHPSDPSALAYTLGRSPDSGVA